MSFLIASRVDQNLTVLVNPFRPFNGNKSDFWKNSDCVLTPCAANASLMITSFLVEEHQNEYSMVYEYSQWRLKELCWTVIIFVLFNRGIVDRYIRKDFCSEVTFYNHIESSAKNINVGFVMFKNLQPNFEVIILVLLHLNFILL